MKKLLSLKKFQKENQDALLEKELLATVNGGIGGGPNSTECERQTTEEGWNCRDTAVRVRWDGSGWGPWMIERSEYGEFYGFPYSS